MSRRKIIFGIILIVLSFSTIFLSILPSIYSNNQAGRVDKQVDVDFDFLKNEKSPYVLLYFGYVGCYTICPPSLNEISQIYNRLNHSKYSFYFVNLQPDLPKENVDQFAKVFNENFKGIYLNNEEIRIIISKLNVKYVPSVINKNEIDHSGFLHILKRLDNGHYQQEFIYTTRPFDIEFIVDELNNL